MGVYSHQALYAATGLTFTAVAACVWLDAEPEIHLTVGIYSLIIHAWLIASWLVKPDHELLATTRAKIQLARLKGALHEEGEPDHANVTTLNRMFR